MYIRVFFGEQHKLKYRLICLNLGMWTHIHLKNHKKIKNIILIDFKQKRPFISDMYVSFYKVFKYLISTTSITTIFANFIFRPNKKKFACAKSCLCENWNRYIFVTAWPICAKFSSRSEETFLKLAQLDPNRRAK